MRAALLLTIAAFALSTVSSPARADGEPGGSYKRTCAVSNFRDSILSAFCARESGPYHRASQLDVRQCDGDIFNRDGGLQCYTKTGWGSGRAIPRGSYIETCRDVTVSGQRISGQCKDGGGSYRSTSLMVDGCPIGTPIDNRDGRLACRGR